LFLIGSGTPSVHLLHHELHEIVRLRLRTTSRVLIACHNISELVLWVFIFITVLIFFFIFLLRSILLLFLVLILCLHRVQLSLEVTLWQCLTLTDFNGA
jgi:hypothetical protein